MRQKLSAFVTEYPILIQLAFLIFALGSIAGLHRAKIDNDHRIYFAEDNSYLIEHEHLQNTYNKDDSVSFIVVFKNGVFNAENLVAVKRITDNAWKLPGTLRVDSIANYMHTKVDEDDLLVEELVSGDTVNAEQISEIEKLANEHPLIKNRLISADHKAALIGLTIKMNPSNPQDAVNITEAARKLADDFMEKNKDVLVAVGGSVPANASFTEATAKDASVLFPLMFLVMSVFILMAVGSVRGTIYTLYIVFLTALIPIGLWSWLGRALNTSSSIAPLIIITVAIADSIHIQSSIRNLLRLGQSVKEATINSLQKNLLAVFITSFTTAIGFLGLNIGDVPPFQELGNLSALGVLLAFIASVTVLPAMIITFGLPPEKAKTRKLFKWPVLLNFIANKRKVITFGFVVVFITLGSLIPKLKIQDNLMEYFDETFRFRKDTDVQMKYMKGYDIVDFSLDANKENGVFDPQFLNKFAEFENWCKNQKHVIYTASILPVLKELNQRLHRDDPQYYRIPLSQEEAAQYFLLYEMSLPFGRDVNNQIDIKRSKLRISIALEQVTNIELLEFVNAAENWLDQNFSEYQARPATGISVMFANLYFENTHGMFLGTLFSFFLITLTLMAVFRSFSMGLLSLLPNILPAVMTFGIWYLIKGEIGLIGSTVTALTLGIVVDDTVHFLSHYLKHRRDGLSVMESIGQTYASVGDAIVFTSLILALGFAVLGFSGFQLNEYLGKLCLITIFTALILDLIFLPALLLLFDKNDKKAA